MGKFYKIAGVTAIASLCIGIILVVTGLIFGGKHSIHAFWNSDDDLVTKSYSEVDAFDSIEIYVEGAKVTIERGDKYGLEYKLVGDRGDIDCDVKDGVLKIVNEDDGYDDDSMLNFFSWNDDAYVRICVPENVDLDHINIDTNAGNIKIEDIVADEFNIESDAGNINLNNVESVKGIIIDTNAGNLNVEGKLAGDCEFSSDCGNVNIVTYLSSDMYSYDADTDVGHVDVTNGDGDNLPDSDNEGKYNMSVETDLGNVDLTFK